MSDLMMLRLNYNPPDILELGYGEMFRKIEEVTVIKPLMQTFDRFIFVCGVVWKAEPDIDFLNGVSLVESASEISREGNMSLIMVYGKFPEIYTDIIRKFFDTFNCFLEFPARLTEKTLSGTIVGTNGNINRFLSFAKAWGATYEVVSIRRYLPHVEGALSNLTPRQFNCMEAAVRLGYFDIPRKINSRELATELGLSHATVLEHIKKAQREIFHALFKE